MDDILNQLLPNKQPPLQRALFLLSSVAAVWLLLSLTLLLLFDAVAPQLHVGPMTYTEALGWVGFYLAYVGTSQLLKESK